MATAKDPRGIGWRLHLLSFVMLLVVLAVLLTLADLRDGRLRPAEQSWPNVGEAFRAIDDLRTEGFRNRSLVDEALATTRRVALVSVGGAGLGALLGLATRRNATVRVLTGPTLTFLGFAFVPAAVVLWASLWSTQAMVVGPSMTVVLLIVANRVREFPSPDQLVSFARLVFLVSWVLVTVLEFNHAASGFGPLAASARSFLRIDVVIAVMFWSTSIAFLIDRLILVIGSAFVHRSRSHSTSQGVI